MFDAPVSSLNVSLAHARAVLDRALGFAAEAGLGIAAVIVDAAGHPVAAERMDGASFVLLDIAREKAWTAVAFQCPTTTWRDNSRPGHAYWGLTNALGGRFSVLAGGVPLVADGRVVGAIGVSGGDDGQDDACARHAVSSQAVE